MNPNIDKILYIKCNCARQNVSCQLCPALHALQSSELSAPVLGVKAAVGV